MELLLLCFYAIVLLSTVDSSSQTMVVYKCTTVHKICTNLYSLNRFLASLGAVRYLIRKNRLASILLISMIICSIPSLTIHRHSTWGGRGGRSCRRTDVSDKLLTKILKNSRENCYDQNKSILKIKQIECLNIKSHSDQLTRHLHVKFLKNRATSL